MNQEGGYEVPWFSYQTPVEGDNYIGIIGEGPNLYQEGISQNLSSVIEELDKLVSMGGIWLLNNDVWNQPGTVTLKIWGM